MRLRRIDQVRRAPDGRGVSVSESDIARVLELFEGLGGLSHRKMMGGLSIYRDGQIFAILSRAGEVYLKACGDFAAEMEAAGGRRFRMADGRSMHYWTLPEDALDDPEQACDWARRALTALS